jgi:hypothetical protein
MGYRGPETRRPWWLVGGMGALLITLRLALGFEPPVFDTPALRVRVELSPAPDQPESPERARSSR